MIAIVRKVKLCPDLERPDIPTPCRLSHCNGFKGALMHGLLTGFFRMGRNGVGHYAGHLAIRRKDIRADLRTKATPDTAGSVDVRFHRNSLGVVKIT